MVCIFTLKVQHVGNTVTISNISNHVALNPKPVLYSQMLMNVFPFFLKYVF